MKEKELVHSFPDSILTILECCYDGICISDGEKYLYANSSYERITGIKSATIVGKNIVEVMNKIIDNPISVEITQKKKTITAWKQKDGRELLLTGTPLMDDNGDIKYIVTNVRDLTELVELRRENILLQKGNIPDDVSFEEKMVAESPSMKKIIKKAIKIAKSESSVLILGESGVGKGVVARYIHNKSFRADKTFLTVNCGAIPKNLIESELFGYSPNSFTGASTKGKKGFFQVADGGTLFLDEIGELSLDLQVKLLHAIQEKKITPVGGTTPITVDVRIFSATNKDLEAMVKKGLFRLDLYYRINVIPIIIPPLRERKQDIPELISRKLAEFHKIYGTPKIINDDILESLLNYDWPGNIREIENLIERMVVLNDFNVRNINKELLSKEESNEEHDLSSVRISLVDRIREYEKSIIKNALLKTKNQKSAASYLEIDEATLSRKINKYNLKKSIYSEK
jgi:PAS domain S-box-containing protein